MKKMYGYARVSTNDQNLDRQLIALRDFGIDDRDIIREKASGKGPTRKTGGEQMDDELIVPEFYRGTY